MIDLVVSTETKTVIKVYESWVWKLSSNGASFSRGDKDQRVGRGAQGCWKQSPAAWGRFSQNNWNRKKNTKNLGERGKSVTTGGDLPATDLWTASKVSVKHIWRHARHRAIGHICPYIDYDLETLWHITYGIKTLRSMNCFKGNFQAYLETC